MGTDTAIGPPQSWKLSQWRHFTNLNSKVLKPILILCCLWLEEPELFGFVLLSTTAQVSFFNVNYEIFKLYWYCVWPTSLWIWWSGSLSSLYACWKLERLRNIKSKEIKQQGMSLNHRVRWEMRDEREADRIFFRVSMKPH